ncbi:MAG TPA: hypothetical protein VFF78_07990 [Anaerolineaceae bacterium]|nr:hypothetical protein [Anaerolineaceae bacterium]
MIAERPVLMVDLMAQACAELCKTQTRRTRGLKELNQEPDIWVWMGYGAEGVFEFARKPGYPVLNSFLRCPYGVSGDRLWVKETFKIATHYILRPDRSLNPKDCVVYRAINSCLDNCEHIDPASNTLPWKPSIFMPRKYSRTLLEITDVIPQRIQDMTDADALAEGIKIVPITGMGSCHCLYTIDDIEVFETALKAYRHLFRIVNHQKGGKDTSWARNDWVWKITFKVLETRS